MRAWYGVAWSPFTFHPTPTPSMRCNHDERKSVRVHTAVVNGVIHHSVILRSMIRTKWCVCVCARIYRHDIRWSLSQPHFIDKHHFARWMQFILHKYRPINRCACVTKGVLAGKERWISTFTHTHTQTRVERSEKSFVEERCCLTVCLIKRGRCRNRSPQKRNASLDVTVSFLMEQQQLLLQLWSSLSTDEAAWSND